MSETTEHLSTSIEGAGTQKAKLLSTSIEGAGKNSPKMLSASVEGQGKTFVRLLSITIEGKTPLPKGDATYGLFGTLNTPLGVTPTTLDLPTVNTNECCFEKTVFGDAGGDPFKNDFTGSLFRWDKNGFASAVLELEKNTGSWAKVDDLNDATMGTFYDYGFYSDNYGKDHIGYKLQWQNVLATHGEGTYRVKCIATDILGNDVVEYDGNYCCQQYQSYRADRTIRFEYYNSNILGDGKRDKKAFPVDWVSQCRFRGFMGDDISEMTEEFHQYNNDSLNAYKDTRTEKYKVEIYDLIDAATHEHIITDILMSDKLLVTDYNADNAHSHIDTPVRRVGISYEPIWTRGKKKAPVEFTLTAKFNNQDKRFC